SAGNTTARPSAAPSGTAGSVPAPHALASTSAAFHLSRVSPPSSAVLLPGFPPYGNPGFDLSGECSLVLGHVQRLVALAPIDLGDVGVPRGDALVTRQPLQQRRRLTRPTPRSRVIHLRQRPQPFPRRTPPIHSPAHAATTLAVEPGAADLAAGVGALALV